MFSTQSTLDLAFDNLYLDIIDIKTYEQIVAFLDQGDNIAAEQLLAQSV